MSMDQDGESMVPTRRVGREETHYFEVAAGPAGVEHVIMDEDVYDASDRAADPRWKSLRHNGIVSAFRIAQ